MRKGNLRKIELKVNFDISGGDGLDALYGNSGNDTLAGSYDDDYLNGF